MKTLFDGVWVPRLALLAGVMAMAAGGLGCGKDTDTTAALPEADAAAAADEDTIAPPADVASVPTDVGPNEPTGPKDLGPQPTHDGDWEWWIKDDNTAVGAHTYTSEAPKGFYEYQRFESWEPFEVRAIQIMVQVPAAETLRVYIWDDFGGNFLSFEAKAPLKTVSRGVTESDSGTWLTLPIDPPLAVKPGHLIYAGVIVDGNDGIRMMVDAAQDDVPDGLPAGALIWLSNAVDPETNTHTVYSGAAGDYMLRLEARKVSIIDPADTLFEPWEAEALGVPSLSRAAFDDIDGDGDIDLMSAGGRLYENLGGVFQDITATAMPEGITFNGGVFGDFDNDGDPDWFGTGGADVLLRNDNGIFVDVTAASGIDDTQLHTCDGVTDTQHVPTEAAAWFDADNDGLLDLYQGNFICWGDGNPSQDRLWHNNGDGTFSDISDSAKINAGQGTGWASRGLAPADYDNDGDMDLLVTNYRLHPNLMWRNNGDGTFTNVATETRLAGNKAIAGGSGWAYGHSIGAAWADLDRDGSLDVFVANLAHPRFIDFSDKQTLYVSSGGANPIFFDVTADYKIRYQETPSNPTAWDLDNDGDLDLTWTCIYDARPSQTYRNDGALGWTDLGYASGLKVTNGWGSVVGDVDNDGDLDYLSRTHFRNRNRFGNRAVAIRPQGGGTGQTNKSGIGVRVTVTANGASQLQERAGTHGTGSGDTPWLHFGIGKAETADVRVRFPASGLEYEFKGVAAGRYTATEAGTLNPN